MKKTGETRSQRHKRYYLKNRDKIIESSKGYYLKNKDAISEYKIKYRLINKEKLSESNKRYRVENRETIIIQQKESGLKNKDKKSEYDRNYKKLNKDKIYSRQKDWTNRNKDRLRIKNRESMRRRWKNEPKFRLNSNIKVMIYLALKGKKCGVSWKSLVEFTLEELVNHLESQFSDNMNWENYGSYWHLDHKRPKSWFHYNNVEDKEFKKCWSLNNLQPLLAKDNLSKGNKYESI